MSLRNMLMRGLAISGYANIMNNVSQGKIINDAISFEQHK